MWRKSLCHYSLHRKPQGTNDLSVDRSRRLRLIWCLSYRGGVILRVCSLVLQGPGGSLVPMGPMEALPAICGLCGTPYQDDECPTCRTEREDAKALIERRLREDREDKDRLIRDVEEWLDERGR